MAAAVPAGGAGGGFRICARLRLGAADQGPRKRGAEAGVYVLQMALSPPQPALLGEGAFAVACATSDLAVELLAVNAATGQLRRNAPLRGHSGRITDVRWVPGASHMLLTCGEDGNVALWDMAQSKALHIFKSPKGMPISCCASDGQLLAAGAENHVLLWNLRTGKALGALQDLHTGDVTRLQFHPRLPHTLFSSGEDGLINMFKLSPQMSDLEDALDSTFSVEQTASRFGFFGPRLEFMYCITMAETLSLWSLDEDGTRIADFPSMREQLSRLARTQIHYLVDCAYHAPSAKLVLFAGTQHGLCLAFAVEPSGISPFGAVGRGHASVVRDVLTVTNDLLLTGGEDGYIVAWTRDRRIPQLSPAELRDLERPRADADAGESAEERGAEEGDPTETQAGLSRARNEGLDDYDMAGK